MSIKVEQIVATADATAFKQHLQPIVLATGFCENASVKLNRFKTLKIPLNRLNY
jgi:hypothetical protein